MDVFIVLLMVFCIGSVQAATNTEKESTNTPYWNYLLLPRLTFSGTFRADVPTINNRYQHFDTENFVQRNTLPDSHNWNPMGSGEWSVDASVTNVCYLDGQCVTDHNLDDIVGSMNFRDGGNKTSAKIVDIDTQAKVFPEIWGWRIQIRDYFSADFTPVPVQFTWNKMFQVPEDPGRGAAFQSVLTNIRWFGNESTSPFYKQLLSVMKNDNIDKDKLSIRFNVDMQEEDSRHNNFTYGRIVGSIGLLGSKSPPFSTHGRLLKPKSKYCQDAHFVVDKRKINVDFGNSLPINTDGSFNTGYLKDLYVGIALKEGGTWLGKILNAFGIAFENEHLSCNGQYLWLGKILNNLPTWYSTTAGIQSFPPSRGSLSNEQMELIKDNPLVVAEVTGTWPAIVCSEIVFAEDKIGIEIHPYSGWIFRKNDGENATIKLLATKYGEPLTNHKVLLETNNCTNLFGSEPKIGDPALPFSESGMTDENGIATFNITAKDPKNPRKFIDGQLHPFAYYLDGQKPNFTEMCSSNVFELLNHLIIIRVWDKYVPSSPVTWLDDVHPIFLQYAQLFPVMKQFVDLGNYYDVVKKSGSIAMTMELPMSHPNHMPVTRDLSSSKRDVIVKWLKSEYHKVGDFDKYRILENLRKDLQTALEIEHATIPPYLTALATLKSSYNPKVHKIIRQIVIQEMMHLTFVANILNAIGGNPVLYSSDFLPKYPASLPGGVRPDLVVPIEKLSINVIRNVFMKIEEPELVQEHLQSFFECASAHAKSKYTNSNAKSCPMSSISPGTSGYDEEPTECIKNITREEFMINHLGHHRTLLSGQQENEESKRTQHKKRDPFHYQKHHNTIGLFYMHILNTLGYLTDCGQNNSIFIKDSARQVKFWHHNDTIPEVKDFQSAVEAIKVIVDQGEGSSPCNPMYWKNDTSKDLSHYFQFYSILEHREIVVDPKDPKKKKGEQVEYPKLCNGTYYFTGPKIPFDPDAVWPMVPNPQMSKYKEGSRAYLNAMQFNQVYTKLLKSLHNVFNGHPDHIKDALGLMASVELHLKKLIKTPIHPDGDPDIGPNAGPTYDFVP